MSALSLLSSLAERKIKVTCSDQSLRIDAPSGLLTKEDKEKLSKEKLNIIELYRQYNIESNFDIANLSDQQMGIWYINHLNSESKEYNIVSSYRIDGFLNLPAFQECIQKLINRHDILKTNIIVDENNIPWQLVNNSHVFSIDVVNLDQSEHDPDTVFQEQEAKESRRVFDLTSDLMIFVSVVNYPFKSKNFQALIINIHHIAFDGWSLGIFTNELVRLYNSHIRKSNDNLDNLAINYRDFSRWQKSESHSEAIEKEKGFWQAQLKDISAVHTIPLDYPRPAILGNTGLDYRQLIPIELEDKVIDLAKHNNASQFSVWYTLFSLFISKISSNRDIVIGTAVANREIEHTKDIVGLFTNTIPFRSQFPESIDLQEAISSTNELIKSCHHHQGLPLSKMVELSKTAPSLSYTPLFQIIFSHAYIDHVELENLKLTPLPYKPRFSKYDLSLTVEKTGNSAALHWEFNNELFTIDRITILSRSFLYFVQHMIEKQVSNIFREDICPPDLFTLINSINQTQAEFTELPFFFQEFEQQTEKTPDKIAITDKVGDHSYEELNQYANKVAHYLRSQHNATTDTLIAVCMDRNFAMVAFLLGIMKSGAAYIPLDPNYPIDRLQFMLDDAKPVCVITTQSIVKTLPLSHPSIITVDESSVIETILKYPDFNIYQNSSYIDRLAYVIYTSGSTGNPKGVMIEHKGLSNFLYSMKQEPGIEGKQRLLAVTSTSFDIHILELFLPLISGNSFVLADTDSTKDPFKLMTLIESHDINLMQATPTSWQMLFDAGWKPDKKFKILCGGEAINDQLLSKFLADSNIELWNMYGPTEATVWSSVKKVSTRVFLGAPIANTTLFILDEALNPVLPGCIGELYIGGDGLARGYLNNPELTQLRFLENVRIKDQTYRLYKTGDLCKQDEKGNIEYIGRADNQVKIRGFRIELLEIENVISNSGLVKDVCVVIKKSDNSQLICAYITQDPSSQDTLSIRNYLANYLPDFMIPSRIVTLDELPKTPNKKIDRKELSERALEVMIQTRPTLTSEKDRVLIETLSEVLSLNLQSISMEDNFYYLGGDSITALRYISALKRKGYSLDLHDLIQNPRLNELSQHITKIEDKVYSSTIFSGNVNLIGDHKFILMDEKKIARYTINGLMDLDTPLEISVFNKAFNMTSARHEVSRCRLFYENGEWRATIVPPKNNSPLTEHRLGSSWNHPEIHIRLGSILLDIQNKLSLYDATHYVFALITSNDNIQKLMFSVNHTLIDGYSNGIFLEDLFSNYQSLLQGETNTYIHTDIPTINIWTQSIQEHINSSAFKNNICYWEKINLKEVKPFPSDRDSSISDKDVTHESIISLTETLSSYHTEIMRHEVPSTLHISHLDFVIAVISLTLGKTINFSKTYLHIKDSGRPMYNQMLNEQNLDISRVVSSFSELAPKIILVDSILEGDVIEYIQSISKNIQSSSKYSQTFKLLKYATQDSYIMNKMKDVIEPDIMLNFLGMNDLVQVNEKVKSSNHFLPKISEHNSLFKPVDIADDTPIDRRLFLSWRVEHNKLQMSWGYSTKLNSEEFIRKIATACKLNLENILLKITDLNKNKKKFRLSNQKILESN